MDTSTRSSATPVPAAATRRAGATTILSTRRSTSARSIRACDRRAAARRRWFRASCDRAGVARVSRPPGRSPTTPSATNRTDSANADGAATPALAEEPHECCLAGADPVEGDRQQHHQQNQRHERKVHRQRQRDPHPAPRKYASRSAAPEPPASQPVHWRADFDRPRISGRNRGSLRRSDGEPREQRQDTRGGRGRAGTENQSSVAAQIAVASTSAATMATAEGSACALTAVGALGPLRSRWSEHAGDRRAGLRAAHLLARRPRTAAGDHAMRAGGRSDNPRDHSAPPPWPRLLSIARTHMPWPRRSTMSSTRSRRPPGTDRVRDRGTDGAGSGPRGPGTGLSQSAEDRPRPPETLR